MLIVARRARLFVGLIVWTSLVLIPAVAFATAEDDHDTGLVSDDADLLSAGATVYASVCQACHQPGGVGSEGVFPPLLDNPSVQDTAYVEGVILNGRTGELVVRGITYDTAMPAFALAPEDVDAVVAYVQAGFPDLAEGTAAAPAPVAGTAARELPGLSSTLALIAYVVVAGAFLAVLGPVVVSRGAVAAWTWTTAWLKAAAIVVFFVVGTVFIPSWVLELGPVSRAPRAVQDVIGTGAWATFLALGLYALWRAKREHRV